MSIIGRGRCLRCGVRGPIDIARSRAITSLPLVSATTAVVCLQADQLVVQGMMASRYLAQFEEVVTKWQKQLSMVR